MVKTAKNRYTYWKVWHSPASHSKCICTATLHEIYMDCTSRKIVPAWKVDDPMSYCDVFLCLGEQMM
eukprot:81840-Ditylum_brightwellii.AAC.1